MTSKAAAFKARMIERGLVQANEWIPSNQRALFKAVALALRQGVAVTVGDPEPGLRTLHEFLATLGKDGLRELGEDIALRLGAIRSGRTYTDHVALESARVQAKERERAERLADRVAKRPAKEAAKARADQRLAEAKDVYDRADGDNQPMALLGMTLRPWKPSDMFVVELSAGRFRPHVTPGWELDGFMCGAVILDQTPKTLRLVVKEQVIEGWAGYKILLLRLDATGHYSNKQHTWFPLEEDRQAVKAWFTRHDNTTGGRRERQHYDILGLEPDATPEQVKAAWKRFASQHHPDKGGDAETFKRGRAAYEALSPI